MLTLSLALFGCSTTRTTATADNGTINTTSGMASSSSTSDVNVTTSSLDELRRHRRYDGHDGDLRLEQQHRHGKLRHGRAERHDDGITQRRPIRRRTSA